MKKIIPFSLLLVIASALISCGGNSANDNGKTVVNFFGWGDKDEQGNFRSMINTFMDLNPDIKVVYDATDSRSYKRTLNNMKTDLPDVFYVPDYDFLQWASGKKILDLTDYITQEEINSVWPESISMYRFDKETSTLGTGAIYGLPKDLGPYSLVFNKNMLDSAIAKAAQNHVVIEYPSYTSPMTVTEFVDYLTVLKPYLVSPTNTNGYGISSYEIMDAVWSNNADFFSSDAKTSKITEKNFTDAIQWIADLSLVHKVMPTAKEQKAQNGYQRFLNKGCLFTFMGPWDLKAYWEGIDFDFDLMPTPVGTASGSVSTSWVGSVAFCVKNELKKGDGAKLDASIKLAKWLTFSEEANKMNVQLGQAMPNIRNMAENEFVNNTWVEGRKAIPEHKNVWVDLVKETYNIKHHKRAAYYLYDSTPYDDLLADLSPVWTGEQTAENWAANYNTKFQKGLTNSAENLE